MEGTTMEITLEDIKIPVNVLNDNRRNGIKIIVDMNGIKVYKRSNISDTQVISLIEEKSQLVLKHFKRFTELREKIIERKWDKNEEILFRGKETKVHIIDDNKEKPSVAFNGEYFEVFIKKEMDSEKRLILINDGLRTYLKESARNIISKKLKILSELIGVNFNSFKIKEQKTRWGSCSRKGNLNFNWKIIMAPEFVLDYVLIHELCHLKQLNHSKEFWNLVAYYMPEYFKADQWLRKNGYRLNL